jgi:hypothetical protein
MAGEKAVLANAAHKSRLPALIAREAFPQEPCFRSFAACMACLLSNVRGIRSLFCDVFTILPEQLRFFKHYRRICALTHGFSVTSIL